MSPDKSFVDDDNDDDDDDDDDDNDKRFVEANIDRD